MNVNQEHDAIRLGDKGSCSDCGRPMADKMADFALETQGWEHLHVTVNWLYVPIFYFLQKFSAFAFKIADSTKYL